MCLPASNCSFIGKSISRSAFTARRMPPVDGATPTVHVDTSPASAVNVALHHLAPDVDLVISGPNIGHNCGRASVLSSGTVGAALEGTLAGRRAIAISFPFNSGWGNWPAEDVAAAVEVAARVTTELWGMWCQSGGAAPLYNINVPLGGAGRFSADAAGAVGQPQQTAAEGGGGESGSRANAWADAAVAPTVAEAIASGGVAHVAGARVVRTFVDDRATYGSLFGELAPRTTADPGGKSPVGAERSGRPRARRRGGRCWN